MNTDSKGRSVDEQSEAKCEKAVINLLLEEWKQNVSLYIDQDKRGLERIKIFLTVHAGLFVFYGILWNSPRNVWAVRAAWIIVVVSMVFTIITHLMSKRAHAFILLRRLQGMLIEKKLKNLIAPEAPWRTSEGIITTFTREHLSFISRCKIQNEWKPLIDEVVELWTATSSDHCPITLEGHWKRSMGHLKWLRLLYLVLYFIWPILGVMLTWAYYFDC